MNYPVWQLDFLGGGLLIAAIAVFHVYISHFAVGGGLFLVLTELKAYRDNDSAMLEYVRKHTAFFLLITMVAGGITGVGIWFTISLLQPAATSVLIHTFVFGWASEWVFFVIEIVALFIYYYGFRTMQRRHHLIIGWIYFGAAWMSLFIINGIIDFMLTPGSWVENRNFWSGFFNPTFWPALAFRTFFALLIAGLFGFVTATWSKNSTLRITMTRFAALWLLIPFVLFLFSAFWYKAALPPQVHQMLFEQMPAMTPYIKGFIWISPILVFGGLLLAIRLPRAVTRPIALVMLFIGLLYMGSFEFLREGGRKPYIIYDYMYSNAIYPAQVEAINQQGLLTTAKWSRHASITDDNRLAAGREVFNILCSSCHSIGGPMHDIQKATVGFTPSGLDAMISGLQYFHPYMPPFAGTEEERYALASFIAFGLNGRSDGMSPLTLTEKQVDLPPFDTETATHLLLAWNTLGMHTFSDTYAHWAMQPPGNTIHAQLILRGETPEIVTDDVVLTYAVEPAFSTPSEQVDFWDTAEVLFGKRPEPNIGLTGNGLQGTMQVEDGYFSAEQLPVVPYTRSGYDPYPVVTLEARDASGTLLAQTMVTAPAATEMGCNQCHGGQWRVEDRAGFTSTTAHNILVAHDRMSGTDLAALAAAGEPKHCRSCHAEQADAAETGGVLNLSAAIHGFHAVYLSGQGAESCALCHPSSPAGATQKLRGIHNEIGLDCTSCHGTMEEHALSLLNGEKADGRSHAQGLISHLEQVATMDSGEITPRRPWIGQPDCLNCHVDFEAPETDITLNQWTTDETELYRNRTDDSGSIRCAACHGSPHAVYPAANDYGEQVHNLQPLQYQGNTLPIGSNSNCAVCHTIDMEYEMHHPNMLREFRNQ